MLGRKELFRNDQSTNQNQWPTSGIWEPIPRAISRQRRGDSPVVVPVVNRQIASHLSSRPEVVKEVPARSESRIFSWAKKKSQIIKEKFEQEKKI